MHDVLCYKKYKGLSFKIEIVKSEPEEFGDWECNDTSAISNKALIRITEESSISCFYSPYKDGEHYYDFDDEQEIYKYKKNNYGTRKANTYFILIFSDIDIDDLTGKVAKTIENKRELDRITDIVLKNMCAYK